MLIKYILSGLVTAIGTFGTLITIVSLFVEIRDDGKIKITSGKMIMLMIFLSLISIGLTVSVQLDWDSIYKNVLTDNESPTDDILSGNIDEETHAVPAPNDIITETKYEIICDTSNYSGDVVLSANVASCGETITVTVDAHQFYSINILDADENPIEISAPPILGNTIPFIFDMPASDVTIFIEGE